MTDPEYPPVLLDVIEEHFEELDFLLEQRESVVFAPDWNLFELMALEERAEAHLDGLRLARGHGVDIARPALGGDEIFAAAAATRVLMASGDPALAEEVLTAFVDGPAPESRHGIRLGLRHTPVAKWVETLTDLCGSSDLGLAVAAADVLSFQRIPVPAALSLVDAAEITDRVLAWESCGRLGLATNQNVLRDLLAEDDGLVGLTALRAAARSGMPGLDGLCRGAALDDARPSLEALGFLALFGMPEDLPLLEAAAWDDECAPVALAALGGMGRVQSIPLLVEVMRVNEALAPLAGDAFKRITGVADIAGEKPPPAPIDETDIEGEFDDDTPPPDPDIAQGWWEQHEGTFAPDRRWLGGADVSDLSEIAAVIREASMENRRDLVLCAAAAGIPGAAAIEFEALARRQYV